MKKHLWPLCLLLISSSVWSEVSCYDRGDGIQQCEDAPSSDPMQCGEDSHLVKKMEMNEHTPLPCDKKKTFIGITPNDTEAIQKELNRQCKQKAKEYKRTVTHNLFKKGKIYQGLQAFFKKKRYEVKNGKKDKSKVALDLDAKTIAAMDSKQLNDHIMNLLEEQKPGIRQKSLDALKTVELQGGLHPEDTITTNVLMQTDRNNACVVNVGTFPKRVPAKIEECDFCQEKDIKGSFTNDCAYMVGKNISEKQSQNLLGLSEKRKKEYCQPEMSAETNEMAEVDKMASQLCNIAHKDLTPDFDIETSRNLYADKTPQLAQKRGEFIQKYLLDKLKTCPTQRPWMADMESFQEKVKVSHPEYVGAKAGDYGPNPKASTSEQPKEIENYLATLKLEKVKLNEKMIRTDSDIKRFEDQKAEITSKKIPELKKQYEALKVTSSKIKETGDLMKITNELESMLNSVQAQYVKIDEYERRISDSKKQSKGFKETILNKYSDIEIQKRKEKLEKYYGEFNQSGESIDKAAWDKELFNEFKMVRISGKAVEENELGVDPTLLSPQVKLALNSLVEVESMTCVLDPMKTKSFTLEGVLKGAAKVGMILTLPVTAAVGGAAVLVAMPITTMTSLLCVGCGDPGDKLPSWMAFGNLTQLNLSKASRRDAARNIKNGLDSYINLGGALKVNASKNSTTHDNWEELSRQNEERKAEKED